MYGILFKKDGNENTVIPLTDENDFMGTFKTLEEAKEYTSDHILDMCSETFYVNFSTGEIEF